MTTSSASSEIPPQRSKRLYVLWAIALTLLITAALFCWLVVVPVWRVRSTVEGFRQKAIANGAKSYRPEGLLAIQKLGGSKRSLGKLRLYMRMPDRVATHKAFAIYLMGLCGEAALPEIMRALEESKSADSNERELRHGAVLVALNEIGPPASSLLAEMLAARYAEYVTVGCPEAFPDTLRALGSKAEPTLKILVKDENPEVRQAAANALKKIKAEAQLVTDPVAAIRKALPAGWSIAEVKQDAYPFYRAKGKGTTVHLVEKGKRYEKAGYAVAIFIMPVDYKGELLSPPEETATRAPELVLSARNGKVYWWGSYPKVQAAILKAVVRSAE